MESEISPGVERAFVAARATADRRGEDGLTLIDWMQGLLAEEEGRPYELLTRLEVDVPRLLRELESPQRAARYPAPNSHDLYRTARNLSIRLRGEPTLTTDIVLFALLEFDAGFAELLATLGISSPRLESALRSPMVELPPSVEAEPSPEFQMAAPTDHVDACRIVDASANRARESLRILEDYVRFVRNDRFLTERLKQLRHRLAELCQQLPSAKLSSRNTPGDVGTTVSSAGEYDRTSPQHVAMVNFKRLQESLRSIEEFGKIFGAHVGREIESLRYESYTLERAFSHTSTLAERLDQAKLYFLMSGAQCVSALDWTIAEVAAGGVDIIQLREKSLTDRELLDRAIQVREWTRKANVLFIVNDRADIARLADADGVHLGQDDLRVHDARRILGPDALIGVSTHSMEDVHRAILDGADYIGVGPTFPSQTKSFDRFAGLEFVQAAMKETSLPAFALGGIGPETIGKAVAAGARRVAVSAAIATAEEPRLVAHALREALG